MKRLFHKSAGMLIPADDAAREMLKRIPNGATVSVDATIPRNVKHHRMFWALMTLVHENLPESSASLYPTVEHLVAALKFATGTYETRRLPNGSEFQVLASISFASMDQIRFDEFFDRCADVIAKHFLPGVKSAELKAEVELMVGARAA